MVQWGGRKADARSGRLGIGPGNAGRSRLVATPPSANCTPNRREFGGQGLAGVAAGPVVEGRLDHAAGSVFRRRTVLSMNSKPVG
jgi:hypothetical protein